jgi:hypothetical protein
MERLEEYKPIGSDTIKIYGFEFGRYRYQVEHFDHNKSEKISPEDDWKERIIKSRDYYDSLYGTRVYRFLDWEMEQRISTYHKFNSYIEKDELKEMILNDVIDWHGEDPYDFKDRFIEPNRYGWNFSTLFPSDKEDVKLPYPECENPLDEHPTCPHCGGELDGSILEIECCEDIFNSHGGYGYEGEYSGWWHEVHRCPHCGKLFFIEEEC